MIGFYITRVLMFVGLVAFQVLVLNNLDFNFFINPYIYPLFLLMLPFRTAPWLLMILGFAIGITVDMFSSSEGMHAAATVFMAFVQPSITRLITPKNALETDERASIRALGLTWFITYAGILILIHHTIYFFLEIFSFYNLFTTLSKIVISGITSLLFITLLAYLFAPEKKRS